MDKRIFSGLNVRPVVVRKSDKTPKMKQFRYLKKYFSCGFLCSFLMRARIKLFIENWNILLRLAFFLTEITSGPLNYQRVQLDRLIKRNV